MGIKDEFETSCAYRINTLSHYTLSSIESHYILHKKRTFEDLASVSEREVEKARDVTVDL